MNDPSLKTHDTNRPSCALCHGYITDEYGGNHGAPLVSGKVCDACNVVVVMHRLTSASRPFHSSSETASSQARSEATTREKKNA